MQEADDLQLENQELSSFIENSDDPEVLKQVAHRKGFVEQDVDLYIDVAG